jgi:para-nitrobenzyl esterase
MRLHVRRALFASLFCLCGALLVAVTAFAPKILLAAEPRPDSRISELIVRTTKGVVQGKRTNGVRAFLGIPYAAPPVGSLRWRPPQEAAPWQGVRQATQFSNHCPQGSSGVFGVPSTTEDCLYLNVFAPRDREHERHRGGARAGRPVMVWFPGGGLFSGEARDYDGSKLAEVGDTVVVTLNYRLGALGFFSHPSLTKEGHAVSNYGIMDQQAALRWVRDNIAAFGGDPGNVTIFGQSAGATGVLANIVSPAAAGLFHRAIIQSGTRFRPVPSETAVAEARDFAASTGCADQSAACLRALSVQQILAHQSALIITQVGSFPVIDGAIITGDPLALIESGRFNRVPVMNGLVEDEQAFFLPEVTGGAVLTASGYAAYLASFGNDDFAALEAKYPSQNYASPSLAEIAAAQGMKVCLARVLDTRLARHVPTFAYQFNDETAPSYLPPLSYPPRAYHTAELQYLFPLFHGGLGTPHALNQPQARLSDAMVRIWTHFARAGTPETGAFFRGNTWPPYEPWRDNVRVLDIDAIRTEYHYGVQYDCALWDPILGY